MTGTAARSRAPSISTRSPTSRTARADTPLRAAWTPARSTTIRAPPSSRLKAYVRIAHEVAARGVRSTTHHSPPSGASTMCPGMCGRPIRAHAPIRDAQSAPLPTFGRRPTRSPSSPPALLSSSTEAPTRARRTRARFRSSAAEIRRRRTTTRWRPEATPRIANSRGACAPMRSTTIRPRWCPDSAG